MSQKKDRGYGEHAQRRNAQAGAAWRRLAGPHTEENVILCDSCGKDMGYDPKSFVCAQCEFEARHPFEDES
jgi:hypothetical protein